MRYTDFVNRREWTENGQFVAANRLIGIEEVFAEARRRKAVLNIEQWQMEEYVSGNPMPMRVQRQCKEIDLAANALSRMSPIPSDFADNVYWPPSW
ncbi:MULTISPECIES: hypothetical protein [unclassified Devosia]|uniref:hypothetical protein n=1 Tax=unclassified Devosia TaxID=196773 RepID=UPI00145DD88F|nr:MULTISPECIES: hypothetical protein [unclassified Devosia]MBJ6985879.1 hypothetical protein [Devosia sp. MC521]QMW61256.1 hypothetical protein H4N61_09640 [Devosia sp. MC521]